MSSYLHYRWGDDATDPTVEQMQAALAQFDVDDHEHPDCWVTHNESSWSLAAFGSGLVVWENIELPDSKPRHMRNVPRLRVLELWKAVASGRLDEVEKEPWLPGYG
jgi:hypothetical protein